MTEKKGFALHAFYSRIYKRYDLINRIFTFGLDSRWRKAAALECLLSKPQHVLDLCCGTADLTVEICKQAKQEISITGYDFNNNMLEIARQKVKHLNFKAVDFIEGDAANMPFAANTFDSITIGFGFRNLTFDNPASQQHIDEIYRVLKNNGKLIILESGIPENFFIRMGYKLYLYLFLIPMGSLLSGNFKAYWYLAHSSSGFYSVNQIKELLMENNMHSFSCRRFFMGSANLMVAFKSVRL
jgi:demethylmenaquinone methyltransferase/2-methoxy-6-polyprenyl-1,4-benzoquinol methylase